jgi:Na+:H+ antiporter, NhaA family
MNLRKRRVVARSIARPFEKFIKRFAGGGILLMIVTFVALVWANSPLMELYNHVWDSDFALAIGSHELHKSLLHWINDGLMVIFFFVVGLEIKREFVAGELRSVKQALFPIIAAIGGMIVPIILFNSFSLTGEAAKGWGIPMATDIAFSLAILAVLGSRVPLSLKIFLTALAIVDDLGAILIIAVFYSHQIYWMYLFFAFVLLLLLVLANYLDIQNLHLYTIVGLGIWFLFLKSGIHPTIAGVLIAFTIPARPKIKINTLMPKIKWRLRQFMNLPDDDSNFVLDNEQLEAIDHIEELVREVQSPLQMIEHHLSGMVNYIILPLFALANAGVTILAPGSPIAAVGQVFTTVSLVIAFSLVFGKMIGIALFSWLAVKLKICTKPKNISWLSYIGVGLLGGIGFTMSLFIVSLAFVSPALQDQAKVGVFFGSLVAGVAGFLILKYSLSKSNNSRKVSLLKRRR